MIEVLYFAIIFLFIFSVGSTIFKKLKLNLSFIELVIFSSAIGFGVLSYITFILGILGIMYRWIIFVILFLVLCIFFKEIKYFILNTLFHIKNFKKLRQFDKILIVILAIFIILNILVSLSPPFLWDELDYNLAIPKIYARHHKLVTLDNMYKSHYPFNINILFSLALVLKNAYIAKLIMFGYGTLLAFAVFSFGHRYFDIRTGLISMLIFYTLPMVSAHITSTYIDIGVAFYVFLAFYAFIMLLYSDNKKWFYVSAIMSGLSISSKHLALYYLPVMFIFLSYKLLFKDKKNIFKYIWLIGLYFIISFLLVSPWYVKNYIETGNPIWPFGYYIFGGKYLDKEINYVLTGPFFNKAFGGTSFVDYITFLWQATMNSSQYALTLGFGVIFLAFVPLIIFVRKNNDVMKYLILFSIMSFTIWFFGRQVLRYLLIYPMLSIISGSVITLLLKEKKISKIILFLFISALLFNSVLWVGINYKKFPFILNLETEQQFYAKLKGDDNGYNVFKYLNEHASKNSKLLLFGETRGYLSDIDYYQSDPKLQKIIDYGQMRNAKDMYARLKELGIDYVLINIKHEILRPKQERQDISLTFYDDHSIGLMNQTLANYGDEIYSEKDTYLYKLR